LFAWKKFFDALSVIRTIWFFISALVLLAGGGWSLFTSHPLISGVLIVAGLAVLAVAVFYVNRHADLKILSVEPEVTNDPKITYKSKLRVVIKNSTKRQLRLGYVRWGYGVNAVPDDPSWYLFQSQDPAGFWESANWGPERKSITVDPDRVFRVSVALPPGTTDAQIRSAHAKHSLGVLRLVPNGSDQPSLKDIRL
jgi:hypothetical protein